MTSNVKVRDQQQTSVHIPETPVEESLEAILHDARDRPERYLDETIVKHGGE